MKKIFSLLTLALGLLTACESYTDPTLSAPTVTTGAAENIYRMGATLSGSYIDGSAQAPALECGILVSEMQSMPEPQDYKAPSSVSGATYTIELSGLTPGKTYYYQSYAGSGASVVKGEVRSFTTTFSNPPIFAAPEVAEQKPTSCVITASLVDDGASEMLMTGFFWKEDTGDGVEPTFVDPSVSAVNTNGLYQATFKNLRPGHTYLMRPYGVNGVGIGLGKTVSVVMERGGVPSLIDPVEKAKTRFSVTLSSRVFDTGTSDYTQVGFCWSKSNPYPTINDDHQLLDLPDKTGDGTFEFQFEADEQLTTYYICAFAKNDEEEPGYSEPYVFTTGSFIELTSYTANGDNLTVYGQVYRNNGFFQLYYAESESALDNPTGPGVIPGNGQPSMDANGRFSETRKDLKPSTTYYVRAVMGSDMSNTLTIKTGEVVPDEPDPVEPADPTPAIWMSTIDEVNSIAPTIEQLVKEACQGLVANAEIQSTVGEGYVLYTITAPLQNMADGESATVKVPNFIGFASNITPEYSSSESSTTGQKWLDKAGEQLKLTYGLKNQAIDYTLNGQPGYRLTACRFTIVFMVQTMEYDKIVGTLVNQGGFASEPTYVEVEPEQEPDTPITDGDGSIEDTPIEEL